MSAWLWGFGMARFKRLGLGSRSIIPLLSGLLIGALVLGWLGIPVVSSEGMFIRSHLISGDIPTAPEDPAWDKIPPLMLPLSGQVITRPVWPDPSARALGVRSVHNGTEIAFLLEWQDNTKNDRLTPGTFRDGVAIGLPLGDAPAFFCMGQLDHYINIWHWKADWQSDIDRRAAKAAERKGEGGEVRRFEVIPRRASSVEDLVGGGFSTLTSKQLQSSGGRWSAPTRKTKPGWSRAASRLLPSRSGTVKTKNAMGRRRWRPGSSFQSIPR